MELRELLNEIMKLPDEKMDDEFIKPLKKDYAKANKDSGLISNLQILKLYQKLLEKGEILSNESLENTLQKRSVRSSSGIVPLQVLMKPWKCSADCIFCPNDATMPKSYINSEPGAMRALLNDFDPIKQTYNRLLSLNMTGHNTDKIEMIVLGGTFDVYPKEYQKEFIKSLYDACNTFNQYRKTIKIDTSNSKIAKFTVTDNIDIQKSNSLQEAQDINTKTDNRIIGLTIETRPEYVTDENCQWRRQLGITRIEMGIQSMDDKVLKANKRGVGVSMIRKAMHKMRQYGFKFSCHLMPGLYKSSIKKDVETFEKAYSDIAIKPDEIKFYPTSVIPNTKLYDLYKNGEYKPLTTKEITKIIKKVKLDIIPPYTRIKRLIRDIPEDEIIAGSTVTNLRQIVMDQMKENYNKKDNKNIRKKQYTRLYSNKNHINSIDELSFKIQNTDFDIDLKEKDCLKEQVYNDDIYTYILGDKINIENTRKFVCLCTRCREIRHREQSSIPNNILVTRLYRSSVGKELFISYETNHGYLYGFVRLLLPDNNQTIDWDGLGKNTALIRELHVYGKMQQIGSNNGKTQHTGIGKKLMNFAEKIAMNSEYTRLSVISGIGVRGYYSKLGYELEGTYMVKNLKD